MSTRRYRPIIPHRRESVDDVQRVTQCPIQYRSGARVEVAQWFGVEIGFRHRDYVVATNDRVFGETVFLSHLDFRRYSSHGPRDGCTRNLVEEWDSSISGEDADWTSSRRRAQICPEDVVTSYHSGVVSAASRLDVSSSTGSGG